MEKKWKQNRCIFHPPTFVRLRGEVNLGSFTLRELDDTWTNLSEITGSNKYHKKLWSRFPVSKSWQVTYSFYIILIRIIFSWIIQIPLVLLYLSDHKMFLPQYNKWNTGASTVVTFKYYYKLCINLKHYVCF